MIIAKQLLKFIGWLVLFSAIFLAAGMYAMKMDERRAEQRQERSLAFKVKAERIMEERGFDPLTYLGEGLFECYRYIASHESLQRPKEIKVCARDKGRIYIEGEDD